MSGLLSWPLRFVVLMLQSAVLAASQIWSNKLRAALTALGIVIGVSSTVTVIAALTGLKQNVLSEFEGLGTNKVFINPMRPETGPLRNASFRQFWFTPSLFDDMLRHTPSVKAMMMETSREATVAAGTVVLEDVNIQGVEPSWHEIENRRVLNGRPFSLLDSERANAVCLLDAVMRDKLRLPRDPTGQIIQVGGRGFLVIGLVEPAANTTMFGGGDEATIYVPFRTIYSPTGQASRIFVTAAAANPGVAEDARSEIAFFLRSRRHIRPGEPDTFRITVINRFVENFQKVAAAITVVATGIVGISLLVGGVGIMNIMLVSVSERTREIGLRKAIGARPSAILLQFLVEAVVLCLLGGLLGVLAGQGLVSMIASIPGASLDKATIPGWAIALSFGFAATVGLIFGMFPAIKASQLDPIEALRHE